MLYLKQADIHQEKFPVQNYYPFNLKIFQNTKQIKFNTPVTLFIGENGTGKSTLLKALAIRCGIHIWQSEFNLRYEHNPYEDDFYKAITIQWENGPVPGSYFGSQIFSHFAKNLEEWAIHDAQMLNYFGGKSLVTQSHGQSLMSYFQSRYTLKGLYFLDEPETALSPASLIELLNLLNKISRQGHAQFLIVTHSPFLMACPGSRIYSFDNTQIEPIKYEDTQYYKIYKRFMADPGKFIKTDLA
ncbi:MAG: AAA family ATPase [Proteobacteria bacterium]|nr:AAA family ATPase [Pseudomonadota bacterium]MBU1586022.1 AAA family ATPase [Pseudomonadota bacterium]MBU2453420.1 AAA family ATPase [Pseudomonadota bacterium]MBU2627461.1 AAA family ATPase [Pseudomonadota bacterium]